MEVAGFTEWMTKPEAAGEGGGDGEAMREALAEFRSGVRDGALKGLKAKEEGDRKGAFKEVLALCDRVRDVLGGVRDGKAEEEKKKKKKKWEELSVPEAEGLGPDGKMTLPKDYFRKSVEYTGMFSEFDAKGLPAMVKGKGGVMRALTKEEKVKLEGMKERFKEKWWASRSMAH